MKRITPEYFFDFSIPLFEKNEVDIIFSEWDQNDFWHKQQSTAYNNLKFRNFRKYISIDEIINSEDDIVVVETSLELFPDNINIPTSTIMSAIYCNYFKLSQKWNNFISNIPVFDIGFSIRRGNFLHYNPKSEISLENAMARINSTPGTKIIFSDDHEYVSRLRKMTGAVMDIDMSITQGTVDHYFSQFLILSRCLKVIGTQGSSFPEQAAIFGNVPFEPI